MSSIAELGKYPIPISKLQQYLLSRFLVKMLNESTKTEPIFNDALCCFWYKN